MVVLLVATAFLFGFFIGERQGFIKGRRFEKLMRD